MKELKTILSRYADNTLVMGPEESKFQLEHLQSDLKAVGKKNKKKVVVRTIAIGVIFILWLWLVWIWRNDAQKISLVFGGSGITISWIFKTIVELWEEKTASEITLTLVVNMRDETSKSIVEVLAKKI